MRENFVMFQEQWLVQPMADPQTVFGIGLVTTILDAQNRKKATAFKGSGL